MMQLESNWLLIAAIALLTFCNWFAAYKENNKYYFLTKPLLLLFLVIFYLLSGGLQTDKWAFAVALILSLLGDIFLIPRSQKWFVAGTVTFFIAHLFYLIGFNFHPAPLFQCIIFYAIGVAIIVILAWYIIYKTRGKPELKAMRKFFLPYSVVLVLMAISAILCLFRPDWNTFPAVLAALGGISFFASDLMHALNRLGKRIPHAKFFIIVSYHIAQFLIVAGVLLNFR